jgi:hypothetical protein
MSKPVPTPRPDHIRVLRDLAANFVRSIDRSALEFEGTATADLTERVACLVALRELEETAPGLTKMATKELRSRLSLLQQVRRVAADHIGRYLSNVELKKRIEYLRQFNEVKNADDMSGFSDEALEALNSKSADIIRARRTQAKADARNAAKKAFDDANEGINRAQRNDPSEQRPLTVQLSD